MYTVIYHFKNDEKETEIYDGWEEMMDAISLNSQYGYLLEYNHRILVKSIEIIL